MFKNFFFLGIALLLVACGNGNNPDMTATQYGYNQNGVNGRICPQPVVQDWVGLVVSNCEGVNDWRDPRAANCNWATQEFANRYPGVDCEIPVQEARWCGFGGDGWRRQKTVRIFQGTIQAIFDRVGPAGNGSFPVNGPGPGHHHH